MPIITIKLVKGRTQDQKQEFARSVTEKAVEILKVDSEWVTILFDEYDRENWASNGELHSLKLGPGYGRDGTR